MKSTAFLILYVLGFMLIGLLWFGLALGYLNGWASENWPQSGKTFAYTGLLGALIGLVFGIIRSNFKTNKLSRANLVPMDFQDSKVSFATATDGGGSSTVNMDRIPWNGGRQSTRGSGCMAMISETRTRWRSENQWSEKEQGFPFTYDRNRKKI